MLQDPLYDPVEVEVVEEVFVVAGVVVIEAVVSVIGAVVVVLGAVADVMGVEKLVCLKAEVWGGVTEPLLQIYVRHSAQLGSFPKSKFVKAVLSVSIEEIITRRGSGSWETAEERKNDQSTTYINRPMAKAVEI